MLAAGATVLCGLCCLLPSHVRCRQGVLNDQASAHEARDGQDHTCGLAYEAPEDVRWGYRHRGNRCEGTFEAHASTAALSVIGFMAGDLGAQPETSINLTWQPQHLDGLSASDLHLKGSCTRADFYYRMDARPDVERGQFDWSMDTVAGLNLKQEELRILATMFADHRGKRIRLTVPVTVSHEKPAHHYKVSVITDRAFDDVFSSLTLQPRRTTDQQTVVWTNKKHESKLIQADDVLEFYIYHKELNEPGLYRLRVGGHSKKGDPCSIDIFFAYANAKEKRAVKGGK